MRPLEALLGHLTSRAAFVVGKGGVGKTTTAGALGLALAERDGGRVHVLSTDPAHSLGDLFRQDLAPGGVHPSACAPGLTLEELDAAARGRAWLEEASPRLAELVERGTYLEGEDVLGMLGPSLPGMDEVVAAFRLVELSGEPEIGRIVVDTAPTGHLLRLLEADRVLEGWADALEAMADKATAVAGQLAGRRVRLSGETLLEELRHVVGAFRQEVMRAADFVVVSTPQPVVAAETGRLLAELRRRDLRVAALVLGGQGGAEPPAFAEAGDVPVVLAPRVGEPAGCEGLRGWGGATTPRRRGGRAPAEEGGSVAPATVARAGGAAAPAAHARTDRPSAPADLARRSGTALERPVLLFAGKGGVGKSTCAAAWALDRSARGETLLLGADPAGSLHDVLGLAAVPGDRDASSGPGGGAPPARPVPDAPMLEVRQVEAEERFDRLKRDYRAGIEDFFRGLGLARSNRLDRRVVESLLELAPPGLDEIFALDALLDALEAHRDVVLDGAPTGHFLRLVEMPEQAIAWTRGLLRALLRYRSAAGLDEVAERVLRLSRSVRALAERLSDPACTGVVVVTLPGALPVAETRHLLARLRTAGLPVAGVVHNRYSPGSAPSDVEAPEGTACVIAPDLEEAPVGVDALRSFVSQWEWR